MKPVDFILIAVLVLLVGFALWRMRRRKRKGDSCCGGCEGCEGCCENCIKPEDRNRK